MSAYQVIDGIKCFSPELALKNNDYSHEIYEVLYKLESSNFWFTSRNAVIKYLFKKYLKATSQKEILEIGCGTGFVLSGLSENKNYSLTGAEIYLQGLKYAKQRLPNIEFIQLDATKIPFGSAFDAIGTFDVLEHISEDELVMKNIFSALKKGGFFFISVPQYKFMWSYLDEVALHKRRYSKRELKNKVSNAGFKVRYTGSFVLLLFPFMVLSRLMKKNEKQSDFKNHDEMFSELHLNPLLNSTFKVFMKIDEALIRLGISLPFGGSLILVAEK